MKMRKTIALAIVLLPMATLLMSSCSKDTDNNAVTEDTIEKTLLAEDLVIFPNMCDSIPMESLSAEETEALLKMREEEYLAHDIYVNFGELYALPVFTFISRSEQQHTNAIAKLLVKYGLTDPAIDHQTGVFVNEDLQSLYNSLLAQGQVSLIDALTVGATIEDLDIKDLMDLSLVVDNQDLLYVFANLTKGSRNHMRSFSIQLTNAGVTYTPQYISAELYQYIITTPHERGPVAP